MGHLLKGMKFQPPRICNLFLISYFFPFFIFLTGQKFAVLEEKAVLSSILRKYKIKSIDPRNEMKIVNELIVRPKNGINVILEKR